MGLWRTCGWAVKKRTQPRHLRLVSKGERTLPAHDAAPYKLPPNLIVGEDKTPEALQRTERRTEKSPLWWFHWFEQRGGVLGAEKYLRLLVKFGLARFEIKPNGQHAYLVIVSTSLTPKQRAVVAVTLDLALGWYKALSDEDKAEITDLHSRITQRFAPKVRSIEMSVHIRVLMPLDLERIERQLRRDAEATGVSP